MPAPYRVLVVDDSTFMRGALVRMIEKDPRFKVIDVAVNGKEGVEKALALEPDVVTMDIEMPIMTGIEALKAIVASGKKIPVIMVSTLSEAGAAITMEALEIGAVDFIPKALSDKDKNIFRGAGVIHEKLLGAVHASGSSAGQELRQQAAAAPVVAPKPSNVLHSDAKIVVIGSSTGGPKALQAVLQKLPANLPVPVVVAQHMPKDFTRALAKRLDETCPPNVVEAQDGEVLMPGKVYIAPGGMHLRLTPTGVRVGEDKGESPYRPSVDVLTESVFALFKKQVLGVMLTGMGNDGTRAFVAMKEAGAHTIGQDQATCVVYGMPRAAYEAGGISEVLPIERIGQRIAALLM